MGAKLGFSPEILDRYLNAGCAPEDRLHAVQSIVWNVLDDGDGTQSV